MARPQESVRLRLVESTRSARLPAELDSSRQLDDVELLRAVQSGEDWAAPAFCRRVLPRVRATIERLLGRQDNDVQDLVQVSLLELVQTIDHFRGDCSIDTWTATVTAHAVFKHIRRRKLERRIFERSEDGPSAAHPETLASSTRIVARDLLHRVRAHLAQMDEGRMWAFLLHDVGGFDLREVAATLSVSVAAAQKRLVRGRQELRERLAEDPELADVLLATWGEHQ